MFCSPNFILLLLPSLQFLLAAPTSAPNEGSGINVSKLILPRGLNSPRDGGVKLQKRMVDIVDYLARPSKFKAGLSKAQKIVQEARIPQEGLKAAKSVMNEGEPLEKVLGSGSVGPARNLIANTKEAEKTVSQIKAGSRGLEVENQAILQGTRQISHAAPAAKK